MNMPGSITATGLKGYLQWLKTDQPALYSKLANQIAQAVPKGFSDYNQSLVRNIRVRQARDARALKRGMSGLGQDPSDPFDFLQPVNVTPDFGDPLAVDLTTQQTDVADAANSGSTLSTIANTVSQLVNTAASGYLTVQQAQAYQQLNSAQLQRAAAGLPPLQVSSTGSGIPLITGTASIFSGKTLLVVGGIALVAILASGRGRKAA